MGFAMGSITKNYALIIIGLMAISCMSILTIESVSAQANQTRPSAPEFTAKVVDSSLEVTIKNQPIAPYDNGSYPSLYYMFRFKDNNTAIGNWDYDPMYFVLPSTYEGYHKASHSDFTTVSLSLEGNQYPSGQMDIQVIALIGIQYPTFDPASKGSGRNGTVYAFEGETSDWSNTQYITMTESNTSPSPTSPIGTINTGQHSPETEPFPTLKVLVIVLIAVAVVISYALLYRRNRKLVKKR